MAFTERKSSLTVYADMTVGYLLGSHVVYQHGAIPILLDSMRDNGIPGDRIFVVVNGSGEEHEMLYRGALFMFRKPEAASHFIPVVETDLGSRLGITHWFYLNCTSRCGPRFRELVEGGFDPDADCTLAAPLIPLGSRGVEGRAINDLAMYRHDYLMSQKAEIMSHTNFASDHGIFELEGLLYAIAPRQAKYPGITYVKEPPSDVYGTGTMRITEYFGAIDWFRYKKNWGQMPAGKYAAL